MDERTWLVAAAGNHERAGDATGRGPVREGQSNTQCAGALCGGVPLYDSQAVAEGPEHDAECMGDVPMRSSVLEDQLRVRCRRHGNSRGIVRSVVTVGLAAAVCAASRSAYTGTTPLARGPRAPAAAQVLDELPHARLGHSTVCPWLATTAADDQLECNHGVLCRGVQCCRRGRRGGTRRCPPNRPVMCASKACRGDHCCRKDDCVAQGGPRRCRNHHVTRVLFVGNSLTYVNDLPGQFVKVAASLGRTVEVAMSAIGGCTLFGQLPIRDHRTASLMSQRWDFLVLQDFSQVPALPRGQSRYFYPAVEEFTRNAPNGAKLILYLPTAYEGGLPDLCFEDENVPAKCWPHGTMGDLYRDKCRDGAQALPGSACMQYALTSGYLAALAHADTAAGHAMFPAGLAWQAAMQEANASQTCVRHVDSWFPPTAARPPPGAVLARALQAADPGAAASLHGVQMNLKVGGHVDKHATPAGQLLNALTLYATLFRENPVGSLQQPTCGSGCFGDDWQNTPAGQSESALSPQALRALQLSAAIAVESCGASCRAVQLGSKNARKP